MTEEVVIVGAGVCGLAAALVLARSGRSVLILESAPRLGEVGAGVQLSPNAVLCLRRLGLADALAGAAYRPEAIEVVQARSGRALLRSTLGAFAERRWGAPYLQVLRSDLQEVLLAAVGRRSGVELRLGAEVDGLTPATGRAGGPVLRTTRGEHIEAEIVLGCDGLRSKVREAITGGAPARFTGQVAWRGLAPRSALPAAAAPAGVLAGPDRHFVYYPVRAGALVNFVAVAAAPDARDEGWMQAADASELLARFADFGAPAAELIGAADALRRWPLYDRPPLASWSRGGAGVLGDAAHPMLPFLAQGAAMALEDAVVLGRCLDAEPAPALGLGRFFRLRRPRTARVQAASRLNARLFHLPDAAAALAFAAAGLQDRLREDGARFDWLYGYDAGAAPLGAGASVGAAPCE